MEAGAAEAEAAEEGAAEDGAAEEGAAEEGAAEAGAAEAAEAEAAGAAAAEAEGVILRPSFRSASIALASPWSAARRHRRTASASSLTTPLPSQYMPPRLAWA